MGWHGRLARPCLHWQANCQCHPVRTNSSSSREVSRLDISREARTTTGSVGHPPPALSVVEGSGVLRPRDNACYRATSRAAPRVVEPVRGSQWQGFGTAGARPESDAFPRLGWFHVCGRNAAATPDAQPVRTHETNSLEPTSRVTQRDPSRPARLPLRSPRVSSSRRSSVSASAPRASSPRPGRGFRQYRSTPADVRGDPAGRTGRSFHRRVGFTKPERDHACQADFARRRR